MKEYDVIVVGAGPAGLTAGIYLARAGRKVAILEKMYAGGQATLTYEIENYPGFLNISGIDLANKMCEQAIYAGAEVIYDEVIDMQLAEDLKIVNCNDEKYCAKALILAMGAYPRNLGIASEQKFAGKGVSYCATCDGAFYKNKTVAVIGGGNTAIEDAIYLARNSKKVYLIHRREGFRATQLLLNKMKEINNIECLLNYTVLEIHGSKKVDGLTVKNTLNANEHKLDVDGVFVAIGRIPETGGLPKEINCNSDGYILTDKDMLTNVKNIYCVGDIREKKVRQVVTACADGAIAGEMASLNLQ